LTPSFFSGATHCFRISAWGVGLAPTVSVTVFAEEEVPEEEAEDADLEPQPVAADRTKARASARAVNFFFIINFSLIF
jgi:hypothetical protein